MRLSPVTKFFGTSFPVDDSGVPYQRIAARLHVPLPQTDLSTLSAQEGDAHVRARIRQDIGQLFDVANGPLLRAHLLHLGDDRHVLAVTLHHLIYDGLSIGIFAREFLALYHAIIEGKPSPLAPVSIHYADYVVWQRACLDGPSFDRHLDYWRAHLQGAPALLELPTDRPRPTVGTFAGADHVVSLSPELSEKLRAFCLNQGTTPYVTLLSCLFALLSRYSGQQDLVIGTMVADRSQPALAQAIGYFVNAVPLRVAFTSAHTALSLLQQVEQAMLGALAYQQMPLEYLVQHLNPQRSASYAPIYQVAFISDDFLRNGGREFEHAPVSDQDTADKAGYTVHDLTVVARQAESGISLLFNYNTDLFERGTIRRLGRHFTRVVEQLLEAPAQRLADMSLLDRDEQRAILASAHPAASMQIGNVTLQQRFEAQAGRTPDAIAVTSEKGSLTYAELNVRANRLAHHLRELGVGPDTVVGLCAERSLEMIVGLLAIVKAGGAYLPLDPSYPRDRLADMLDDAAPAVLLTQHHLSATVPAGDMTVFYLDAQWHELADRPASNPAVDTRPEHLAYVIYTSGSTGRPKGVMVERGGLNNLLDWYLEDLGLAAHDAVLLVSSYNFDLTQKNVFGPLLVGGRLHLAAEVFNPLALVAQIRRECITHINLSPSAFYALVDADPDVGAGGLKRVVLGGEPIQPAKLALLPEPRPDFINSYGPTECTDVAGWHRLSRDLGHYRAAPIPLGKAVPRDQVLPLSFAQQRLWFLAQMEGGNATYHLSIGLRLRGVLDRAALERALDRIVARHEALRTSFAVVDGEPVQHVATADAGFALQIFDLAGHADAERELTALGAQEVAEAFALEHGPLIRGRLVRFGEQDHALLVTMHHIVSDGWSMSVLTRELGTLYRAYRRGEADPLPPLPIQYADYAAWQRCWFGGDLLKEQGAYWQRTLADAPPLLMLPADRVRPPQQDYTGAAIPVAFDEALTAALKTLGRRHGTTLYMTVLAGWAAVLGRLSGQGTVVIGSPAANRMRVEIEGLIGFFVNTLAVPVDVSGDPTVEALLQRVKAQTLGAQAHQDLPFEQVVEAVRPVRSLSHSPVFQAMLAWQDIDSAKLELDGLNIEPMVSAGRTAKFDVSPELGEVDGRIQGSLEFATALFDRETAQRYVGYLERMLRAMVGDARCVVSAIALPGEAERQLVLADFNATRRAYPQGETIHALFEAQVARTPNAVAVVHGDASLSYRELNARANRLAHCLRKQGVGPDVRVAICVERGTDMVVGLLAILKAGGAYVPLDPAYPEQRLKYMLADSAPAAVLAQAATRRLLAGISVPVISLDGDWQDECATNPHVPALRPSHLAYVIHTSGSTGWNCICR